MLMSYAVLPLALCVMLGQSALCPVQARSVAIVSNGDTIAYGGNWFPFQPGYAQRRFIRLRSLNNDQERVIWSMTEGSAFMLEQLTSDPHRRFVAFRELVPDAKNEGVGRNWTLRILTLEGKQVVELPGVCLYAWSPDGSRIAAIEGWYIDSGARFYPKGAYVYDLKTAERIDIPGGYRDVRWPGFDEYLYLETIPVIYRWRAGMEKPEATEYHGLEFSCDGAYYCDGKPRPTLLVYKRKANELLTKDGDQPIASAVPDPLRPRQWLSDTLLLLYDERLGKGSDYILNVETRECRESVLPVVAGRADNSAIVVYDPDNDLFKTQILADCPMVTHASIEAPESMVRESQ